MDPDLGWPGRNSGTVPMLDRSPSPYRTALPPDTSSLVISPLPHVVDVRPWLSGQIKAHAHARGHTHVTRLPGQPQARKPPAARRVHPAPRRVCLMGRGRDASSFRSVRDRESARCWLRVGCNCFRGSNAMPLAAYNLSRLLLLLSSSFFSLPYSLSLKRSANDCPHCSRRG